MAFPESPLNLWYDNILPFLESEFQSIIPVNLAGRPNCVNSPISILIQKNPRLRLFIIFTSISSRIFLIESKVIISPFLDFDPHRLKLLSIRLYLNPWVFICQIDSTDIHMVEIYRKIFFIHKKTTVLRIVDVV